MSKQKTLKVGDCFEGAAYKYFYRIDKIEPHDKLNPQPDDHWITFEKLMVIGGSVVEYKFERSHRSAPFIEWLKPLDAKLFERARKDAADYILHGIVPELQTTTLRHKDY